MTRLTAEDYAPQSMDQGVNHEKVFSHKKETCAAAALQGQTIEKALPAASAGAKTIGPTGPSRRTARIGQQASHNNSERLKEQK